MSLISYYVEARYCLYEENYLLILIIELIARKKKSFNLCYAIILYC